MGSVSPGSARHPAVLERHINTEEVQSGDGKDIESKGSRGDVAVKEIQA